LHGASPPRPRPRGPALHADFRRQPRRRLDRPRARAAAREPHHPAAVGLRRTDRPDVAQPGRVSAVSPTRRYGSMLVRAALFPLKLFLLPLKLLVLPIVLLGAFIKVVVFFAVCVAFFALLIPIFIVLALFATPFLLIAAVAK